MVVAAHRPGRNRRSVAGSPSSADDKTPSRQRHRHHPSAQQQSKRSCFPRRRRSLRRDASPGKVAQRARCRRLQNARGRRLYQPESCQPGMAVETRTLRRRGKPGQRRKLWILIAGDPVQRHGDRAEALGTVNTIVTRTSVACEAMLASFAASPWHWWAVHQELVADARGGKTNYVRPASRAPPSRHLRPRLPAGATPSRSQKPGQLEEEDGPSRPHDFASSGNTMKAKAHAPSGRKRAFPRGQRSRMSRD